MEWIALCHNWFIVSWLVIGFKLLGKYLKIVWKIRAHFLAMSLIITLKPLIDVSNST